MKANRGYSAALLGALILGAPLAAHAQGSVSITPIIGGTFFISQPSARFTERSAGDDAVICGGRYRDALAVGAFAGMHFTPRWELEGLLAWTGTRLEAREGVQGGSVRADGYMYSLHVNYHPTPGAPLAPYLSAGFGTEVWTHDISGTSVHQDLLLDVGVGVETPVSRRLALGIDARDCLSRVDPRIDGGDRGLMSHLLLTAGLSYSIPNP